MTTTAQYESPLPKDTIFASRRPILKLLWSVYDLWVMSVASDHLWGCPVDKILGLYNQYASADHLEAGVGTGYFLDHCTFPVPDPSLTLLDVSREAIGMSLRRLRRYRVTGLEASLLDPLPVSEPRFGSVGMNYVLHCIPGSLHDKMDTILTNLLPCMREGAVLFGTTVLGKGVAHNAVGRPLVAALQRNKIFRNQEDDLPGLEQALRRHVSDYSVELVGRTAMFTARKPSQADKPATSSSP